MVFSCECFCDWNAFLFLQDLPDVQELIAEVSAEKYSLQAAAILGEFVGAWRRPAPGLGFALAVCNPRRCVFRHR